MFQIKVQVLHLKEQDPKSVSQPITLFILRPKTISLHQNVAYDFFLKLEKSLF